MSQTLRSGAGTSGACATCPQLRPRSLLDIGGSHGFYSVALCRRYPGLAATILELPEAIPTAAEILAREGLGDRVVHVASNALEDDLGIAAYDAVLIANLIHHFDADHNLELARKVARALKPGGVLLVMDAIRIALPAEDHTGRGSPSAVISE